MKRSLDSLTLALPLLVVMVACGGASLAPTPHDGGGGSTGTAGSDGGAGDRGAAGTAGSGTDPSGNGGAGTGAAGTGAAGTGAAGVGAAGAGGAGDACGAKNETCCGSAGTCDAGLTCTKLVAGNGTRFVCEPPTQSTDAGTDAEKTDAGEICGAHNQSCCGSAGTCDAGLSCQKVVSNQGANFLCEPTSPVVDAGTDAAKADVGEVCGAQSQSCCGSAGSCNAGLKCTKLVSAGGTKYLCEP